MPRHLAAAQADAYRRDGYLSPLPAFTASEAAESEAPLRSSRRATRPATQPTSAEAQR